MIDEAEPLGYPVVVKNARGHRGKALIPAGVHKCSFKERKQHIYPKVELIKRLQAHTLCLNKVTQHDESQDKETEKLGNAVPF